MIQFVSQPRITFRNLLDHPSPPSKKQWLFTSPTPRTTGRSRSLLSNFWFRDFGLNRSLIPRRKLQLKDTNCIYYMRQEYKEHINKSTQNRAVSLDPSAKWKHYRFIKINTLEARAASLREFYCKKNTQIYRNYLPIPSLRVISKGSESPRSDKEMQDYLKNSPSRRLLLRKTTARYLDDEHKFDTSAAQSPLPIIKLKQPNFSYYQKQSMNLYGINLKQAERNKKRVDELSSSLSPSRQQLIVQNRSATQSSKEQKSRTNTNISSPRNQPLNKIKKRKKKVLKENAEKDLRIVRIYFPKVDTTNEFN